MKKTHQYEATLVWTGAESGATTDYRSYSRDIAVELAGKPPLRMSADPAFRGDPLKLNPEECLLASLSSCHMLSYLAFASMKGLAVTDYRDNATGTMVQEGLGGRFTEVVLKPHVTLAAGADEALAHALHDSANECCFIAASVNFPVKHEATIVVQEG